MMVAFSLKRYTIPYYKTILLIGILLFVFAAAMEVEGVLDGYASEGRFAYGIPSALIILGLVETERTHRPVIAAPFLWLGSASYSIYLFHLTCLGLFYKLWVAAGLLAACPLWISYWAIVVAGLLGGIGISRTVEYPLMRMIQRAGRRWGGKPQASANPPALPDSR